MNLWPEPNYPISESIANCKNRDFIVIGGPCSIESANQIDDIFDQIKDSITHMRGGVFRAGTYPRQKWGWEWDLLKAYCEKSKSIGKPNIVDVLDIRDIEKIYPYTDVFQIGARQAQHYSLLKELGKQPKPVILKRGTWMTLDETLGSVEYILDGGNKDVTIIERGSTTNFTHVRWELSVSMIAALKRKTGLQVVVDASHGSGRRDLVSPLTLAGIASGADGILLETHTSPEKSLSDSQQAICISEFNHIVKEAKKIFCMLRDKR